MFCSFILDRATKFNHKFLAAMLFANDQVLFLELFGLPGQKSKAIPAAFTPLVQHLRRSNLIVIAVCADNATNEKASLNRLHDYSLQ
jgi:hypothetical protein